MSYCCTNAFIASDMGPITESLAVEEDRKKGQSSMHAFSTLTALFGRRRPKEEKRGKRTKRDFVRFSASIRLREGALPWLQVDLSTCFQKAASRTDTARHTKRSSKRARRILREEHEYRSRALGLMEKQVIQTSTSFRFSESALAKKFADFSKAALFMTKKTRRLRAST